jgi:hypothetical protein
MHIQNIDTPLSSPSRILIISRSHVLRIPIMIMIIITIIMWLRRRVDGIGVLDASSFTPSRACRVATKSDVRKTDDAFYKIIIMRHQLRILVLTMLSSRP